LGKAADPAFFPEAERALEEIVSLPLYPGLSDDDVDRVCAAVLGIAEGSDNPQGGTR
jgi:dTDP-4-amino-4,6-dideoxygalactose transaminase